MIKKICTPHSLFIRVWDFWKLFAEDKCLKQRGVCLPLAYLRSRMMCIPYSLFIQVRLTICIQKTKVRTISCAWPLIYWRRGRMCIPHFLFNCIYWEKNLKCFWLSSQKNWCRPSVWFALYAMVWFDGEMVLKLSERMLKYFCFEN